MILGVIRDALGKAKHVIYSYSKSLILRLCIKEKTFKYDREVACFPK